MTDSGRKIFNMVIAFLVSIAAWVFVVYNYYPMTPVKYTEVPVSFKGEKALADRGLAVSDSSMEYVSVTLSQKRVDGSSISADDISVSADVSECVAGDNTVDLKVSGPSGTKVTSVSASSASVEVARIKDEITDIEVVYSEGAEMNAEPVATDLSSTLAEVKCSDKMFDKIKRVAAVLDPEDVSENEKSYTLKLQALDRAGNAIPHVVISPDEISLDAYAGYTKSVELKMNVRSNVDDSYERTYTAPNLVTIKGSKSTIAKVDSITSQEIDVRYIYADEDIDIEYDLPEGVYISDRSMGQKLRLKVTRKESDD